MRKLRHRGVQLHVSGYRIKMQLHYDSNLVL